MDERSTEALPEAALDTGKDYTLVVYVCRFMDLKLKGTAHRSG